MARDVDDELSFHIEARERKLIAAGHDPEEARRLARQHFGDVHAIREEVLGIDLRTARIARRRDRSGELLQDVRYAVRALRRQPVFAVVTLVLLAVGIGANTAIFSLIDAILLRPLPVQEPDRLVAIGAPWRVNSLSTGSPRTDLISVPLYIDLRDGNRVFSGLLASGRTGPLDVVFDVPGAAAARAANAEHPSARFVSGNYFEVLGIPAHLGRTFTGEGGDVAGAEPAVVLSHAYWQRRFAGDRSAVGQTLTLNGAPATIIGVAPPGFDGEIVGQRTDLWIPLTMQPLVMPNQPYLEDRSVSFLLLLGRLRPGVSIDAAESDITAITRRVLAQYAGDAGTGAAADTTSVPIESGARGLSWVREQSGETMLTAMAAVALLLLIVCANVANLLLARTAGRQRELTVRMALGASRGRVLRQLLTESVVLALAAAILSTTVMMSIRALLLRSGGPGIPVDLPLDWRAVLFIAGLAVFTAVLFGTVPSLRARRVDLAGSLRAGARGVTGAIWGATGRRLGIGKVLVVVQIALSLALLVGTAMLARSLSRLREVDLGLAGDAIILADINPVSAGYADARLATLGLRLIEELRSIPGVHAVSFSENGVFSGTESGTTFTIPGYVARESNDTSANYDNVGPGYFDAIGARIIAGRGIEPRDVAGAHRVAVVNATMARFHFGGAGAVGRNIIVGDTTFEIVGIVADVRDHTLRGEVPRRFYLPWLQTPSAPGTMTLELRAPGAPAGTIAEVRRRITDVDAAIPIRRVSSLDERLEAALGRERLLWRVIGLSGTLALMLAAIGLYGVMAYTTMRRTGEFGLRLALGARPRELATMIVRDTMAVVAAGALIGVPAAIAALRLVRNQLFGVGILDLPSFALALLVLCTTALAAGCIPAARAARIGPLVALRED